MPINQSLQTFRTTRFVRLKTLSPESVVAVKTLYDMGAKIFRLSDQNRPAEAKGFYDRQLSLDDLLEHLERRGRLGLEPQSINTVAVDIDDGNADRLLQNFPPLSLYTSKTEGRCHAFYRHEGERISARPFRAPMFRISGDLKHERSYVALYDAVRLAFDLSRGSLGVPFIELEQALVTGPLAAQGGQRGPLGSPVVSSSQPRRFDALSGLPAASLDSRKAHGGARGWNGPKGYTSVRRRASRRPFSAARRCTALFPAKRSHSHRGRRFVSELHRGASTRCGGSLRRIPPR